MHLSVRSKLLVIAIYCLYLPAIARGLPYSVNELVIRADVVDLDPIVDDTGHDDGTTAATGTQDAGSGTSTGGDEPWPVIPDSGAHNGIRDGLDPAGLPYINYALDEIKLSIPAENRRPVFFTDIKPPGRDDFVQDYLHGRGWDYFEAFPQGWEDSFGRRRGAPLTEGEYWLEVNRASNAMARSNMFPEVYVSMDSEGGARSVFNGVQTYDGKGDYNDPSTWVQTNKGVGQIFYQTELPVLMRNPNTQKIIAYKQDAHGDYEFTVQWDANWPRSHPGYKPRNYLPELPLDSANQGPPVVPLSTPDGVGYPH